MRPGVETIIFDLGGVILNFDHHLISKRLSEISNYTEAKLFDLIIASELEESFEQGRISPQDFFKEVIKILDIHLDFERFKMIWNDIFSPPKEEMVRLLNDLKKRKRLYLLSNTNILHFEYVRSKYEILGIFDGYILSYEVGHRKPDEEIYLEALKRSNSSPSECIYIDDIKEYAKAATRVGMRGIHFNSIEELQREIERIEYVS